jgi:hypothetical protein
MASRRIRMIIRRAPHLIQTDWQKRLQCPLQSHHMNISCSSRLRVFLFLSFVCGLAILQASDFAAVAQQEFAPRIQFTAEPLTIQQGQSTTLRWKVDNASAVSIQPAVGTVDTAGSLEVRPSSSTTYTIRASGSGGVATSTVRITVTTPK